MRRFFLFFCFLQLFALSCAQAAIYGQVRGVVHDSQHRPLTDATVELRAQTSGLVKRAQTGADGSFTIAPVALGEYTVVVSRAGFAPTRQAVTLASDTYPVLHFELQVGAVEEHVSVAGATSAGNVDSVTPSVLISREQIAETPGADRTNSLAMITETVPGAYTTHDMLHMRGGHQVSWLIDGVEIPNTNIASNLGAQIDPKDIDYIEVNRGSYNADLGDRTYGAFNVVPRTGFERAREAELLVSAGSFLQANAALSLGDHTSRLAYYASLTGTRSDYGLAPPIEGVFHDATNGYGGFASLIYNRTPRDQLRLVTQLRGDYFQIPYDPNPTSAGNHQYDSSGLRDGQNEADGLVAFSWLRAFNASTVLQLSPFYHYNKADYEPKASDLPIATQSRRTSNYGGLQAAITTEVAGHTVQAGAYSFGQRDNYRFGAVFNDGSGVNSFSIPDQSSGAVVEEYVSDNWKAAEWLTLIAGLRQTRFVGEFTEDATAPRLGLAVRVPKLNWVFRGFYGRFYQPPPLLTAKGPLVQYAEANNTQFTRLRGERDEEHQFGVQIPVHGWMLDADTFQTRVNHFLDHSNLGDSSIYFPVTVDGALVRAWEITVRSPQLWHGGRAYLAYSNQIAEQRGAIEGGLICVPVGSAQCDAGPSYRPVDHDQRNTLSTGFFARLPWRLSASTNFAYGSGFTNGNPDPTTQYPSAYLPAHTSVDLSLGKQLGESMSVSVSTTNVANQRVLLDNSLTFGGFHFNDPREIFGEVRYRFKY